MLAELDVAIVSRVQFAFTIAFHIIFPTLTVGLAMFLVAMEAAWLRTGDEVYFRTWLVLGGLVLFAGFPLATSRNGRGS